MPGKPIEIEIDAVTTGAEKGIDQVADSLDGLDRGLDKVEDAAKDAARVIDRDLTGALDDVKRKAKTAGDSLGDDMGRGARKAGDATAEFKDEARQNFAETASSFDGSVGSMVDLAQGTFGGLAGSLAGPVGLAAGVVAGIGGALYTSIQANAAASEERVRSMFDDMRASGNDYLSGEIIAAEMEKIVNSTDDAAISLGHAQDVASRTGLDLGTVLQAYSGGAEAASFVSAALNRELDKQAEGANSTRATLQEYADQLSTGNGELGTARDRIAAFNEGMGATETAADRALSKISGTAQALRDLPANTRVTISADVDLTAAERTLQRWKPNVRAGLIVSQPV